MKPTHALPLLCAILFFACERKSSRDFRFEKLTFHSRGDGCEGFCPTYHLQIDSAKNVFLYAETVWKSQQEINEVNENFKQSTTDKNGFIIDSIMSKLFELEKDQSKMGYFKGQLSDSTYKNLSYLLYKANIDSLKFDDIACCDGIDKTLIVHYNHKKKTLKSMFPPDSLDPLFNLLYEIIRQEGYVRTTDTIKPEE